MTSLLLFYGFFNLVLAVAASYLWLKSNPFLNDDGLYSLSRLLFFLFVGMMNIGFAITFDPVHAALLSSMCGVLLFLGLVDSKSGYLPDIGQIALFLLSVLYIVSAPVWTIFEAAAGAITAFSLMYGTAILFRRRTGQEGLGFGDIKLVTVSGLILGPLYVIYAIGSGALLALFAVTFFDAKGSADYPEKIPFGPFLCCAIIIMLFVKQWMQEHAVQ